jgi:predicted O-methyltransferase YrrM
MRQVQRNARAAPKSRDTLDAASETVIDDIGMSDSSVVAAHDASQPATGDAVRRFIAQLYSSRELPGEDGVMCKLDALSVTPGRGEFIADVCREYRPARTLEVGMAWGMSTLYMLAAHLDNGSARPHCHTVIDPFQTEIFHAAALRAVRDAGLAETIDFFEQPSQTVLARLAAEKQQFDLAFIDGDHRFEAAFVDWYFIDRLLKPGGVVIFDDLSIDGVYLACTFAEKNHGYIPKAQYVSEELAQRYHYRKDRDGRWVRPALRVYEKPRVSSVRDEFYVAPFWRGLRQFETVLGVCWPSLARNRLNHIGRIALLQGDRITARRAFYRSLRAGWFQPKTWMRLLRTFLPSSMATRLTGPKSVSQLHRDSQKTAD